VIEMSQADIGLVGLAVMGENLILNMESKGFTVAAFNRTTSKVDAFLAGRAKGKRILGAHSVPELVSLLKKPRKVMMMVKAGKAVDDFIEQILPHLEPGDVLIDGGNTHYPDTIRRAAYVESKGMLYVGKRARSRGRRSCPAARRRRGRWSGPSSRRSPPGSRTGRRAATGSARTGPATS
jgi:6-phosphogluconate dehydrogenase